MPDGNIPTVIGVPTTPGVGRVVSITDTDAAN
jgi:hypothetical protein